MSHWSLEITHNRSQTLQIKVFPPLELLRIDLQPPFVPYLPIFDKSYLIFWLGQDSFLFSEPTIFAKVASGNCLLIPNNHIKGQEASHLFGLSRYKGHPSDQHHSNPAS